MERGNVCLRRPCARASKESRKGLGAETAGLGCCDPGGFPEEGKAQGSEKSPTSGVWAWKWSLEPYAIEWTRQK